MSALRRVVEEWSEANVTLTDREQRALVSEIAAVLTPLVIKVLSAYDGLAYYEQDATIQREPAVVALLEALGLTWDSVSEA